MDPGWQPDRASQHASPHQADIPMADRDEDEKIDLPRTMRELIGNQNMYLPQLVADDTCDICREKYRTATPIKLPVCGHIFCVECIDNWLSEGKNSCPMCRAKVLDVPDNEAEEEDYQDEYDEGHSEMDDDPESETEEEVQQALTDWRDDYDVIAGGLSSFWAEHGEALFSDLCEAIVIFIEDPAVLNRDSPAHDWLRVREPISCILGLLTFENFAKAWTNEHHMYTLLLNDMRFMPQFRRNLELLDIHIGTRPLTDRSFLRPTVEMHRRMAAWYLRIRRSHVRVLAYYTSQAR